MEGIDGTTPPWKIILHLLKEFPQDWDIGDSIVRHKPSMTVVMCTWKRTVLDAAGKPRASLLTHWKIKRAIQRIVVNRMLATSRDRAVNPEKYEHIDNPAIARSKLSDVEVKRILGQTNQEWLAATHG